MFRTYGVNIFIDYHPACCDTEKGGIGGKRHWTDNKKWCHQLYSLRLLAPSWPPSVLCSLNPLPHSFSHHLSSPRLPLISLSSSLFPNFYVPILLLPLSPLISFPYSWHFTHVPSSLPLIPLPSSFTYLPSSLFFIPPLTPYSPSFDPRHCPHSSAPLFLSLFPNISPPAPRSPHLSHQAFLPTSLSHQPFLSSLSPHSCSLFFRSELISLYPPLLFLSLSLPGRSTLRYCSAPLLEKY